jgi:hypothetical protein
MTTMPVARADAGGERPRFRPGGRTLDAVESGAPSPEVRAAGREG